MNRILGIALILQICHLGNSLDSMAFHGGSERLKRSILTFPPDSALQITMGLSLGGTVERNQAAVVLGFQQNAKLPNESLTTFFPDVVTARQFSIYDHLKDVISSYGFNGVECLKKMICQIGKTPFTSGLLEDVINFVLSPSKHRKIGAYRKPESGSRENDYIGSLLESENLGAIGGNCSLAFPQCPRSPLDVISYFSHASN